MSKRPPLLRELVDTHRWVTAWRQHGLTVGFVPTMGALHAGHLSLVERSRDVCERTVVSVFINPTQFAAGEDLQEYPRQLENDLDMLSEVGCDAVFAPHEHAIYRPGHSTFVEPPAVSRQWEGEFRPGHFRGVATVVLKLFQIVPADAAFFGQKDFQQALVIQRMVEDLNIPVNVLVEPTIRDSDGLALSSRNMYLDQDQRRRATSVWRSLAAAQSAFVEGLDGAEQLQSLVRSILEPEVDQIDYIAVAHPQTLEWVERAGDGTVILVALRIGSTRLIDNLILRAP